ncbi:serpin-ZX-like [Rhododendron vialii]|uniref:serpin-ZX-like n=1 Tax=Rhododendron vialii TaxID=182163 RepID=UPI00266045D0|nr:serpin-ZX-like [Rhododendron vialii]
MTSKNDQFVSEFNSFKVLKLPYKHGEDERRFSMYFFLPNANDGLSALMEKVSSESGFLEDHLPCERVEVGKFRIPKFKLSFGFEASEVLKGLGLVLPFSPGEAGLTEMVESTTVGRDLYVSSIFHKAFIEILVSIADSECQTLVSIAVQEGQHCSESNMLAISPMVATLRALGGAVDSKSSMDRKGIMVGFNGSPWIRHLDL